MSMIPNGEEDEIIAMTRKGKGLAKKLPEVESFIDKL